MVGIPYLRKYLEVQPKADVKKQVEEFPLWLRRLRTQHCPFEDVGSILGLTPMRMLRCGLQTRLRSSAVVHMPQVRPLKKEKRSVWKSPMSSILDIFLVFHFGGKTPGIQVRLCWWLSQDAALCPVALVPPPIFLEDLSCTCWLADSLRERQRPRSCVFGDCVLLPLPRSLKPPSHWQASQRLRK